MINQQKRSLDFSMAWWLVLLTLPLLSSTSAARSAGIFSLFVFCAKLTLHLSRTYISQLNVTSPALIAVIIVYGFFITTNFTFQSLSQVVQFLILSILYATYPSFLIKKTTLRIGLLLAIIALIFFNIDMLAGYQILSSNNNLYGLYGLGLAAIAFSLKDQLKINNYLFYLVFLAASLLVIASNARSSLVALVVIFLLQNFLPIRYVRWSPILIALSFPIFLYVGLDKILEEIGQYFLFNDKFGLSGRDKIWMDLIQDPANFYGYGLGGLIGSGNNALTDGLSAHNGYLQIFYQFGYFGWIMYICLIISLIFHLKRNDNSKASFAIMSGVLIVEMFEVVLLQNHFGVGLLYWAAIMFKFKIK